jgi:hypothetical protein
MPISHKISFNVRVARSGAAGLLPEKPEGKSGFYSRKVHEFA